jgi:WD40 repeat protein/class 3 adenylate cyclase/tRNA A-37 threonylcarbamoyl transferase component Bud32
LLFSDVVGSTALKQSLGDRAGVALLQQHHEQVRQVLRNFVGAEVIKTAGDSFLILFPMPSEAVKCALLLQGRLRQFNEGLSVAVQDRLGLHMGEVVIEEIAPDQRDVHGMQVDTCSRVMGLARGGQILLTRGVFDSARQMLKGEDIAGVAGLNWVSHGRYLLKGVEEPVEICEVAEAGRSPLRPPDTTEKAQRHTSPDEEPVLGWRPAVGTVVPNTKWVLEQKLGEGGFGEVWLGRHQVMKERRVFKFCFRAERVRSLKREMTLFRLMKERVGDHPNIVSLREVYFDQPPYYVEMDYVEGRDLAHWCEAQGGVKAVPLETRLEIVAQVADALQAAHECGVIHRDVKPGNILVSGQWSVVSGQNGQADSSLVTRHSSLSVKLSDFGIGQVVSEECLAGVTRAGFTQTMLPSSSSHAGTQLYLAPELLAGDPATTRSDIYSLGVVLYQLLVGSFNRPLTSDWTEEIADPLLRDDLRHCVAGKPAERFVGAGQLAQRLRSLSARQAELTAHERAERRAAQRQRVALLAGGAAALLLLLAIVLGYGFSRAEKQRRRAEAYLYDADMILAGQALQQNNLGRARRLLEAHKGHKDTPSGAMPGDDPRGWEWRYLWGRCRGDELITLRGHSNNVQAAVFLNDGRTAVSASVDRTVRFWNIADGSLIETRPYPEDPCRAAVSPGGRWFAIGGYFGYWSLWDAFTRQPVMARTNAASVVGLAFSPDSRQMALIDELNVEVWNVAEKRLLKSFSRGGYTDNSWGFVLGIAFSPDGKKLAYTHASNDIVIRDLRTDSETIVGKSSHGPAFCLGFSPNGRVLASVDRVDIAIWDPENKAAPRHLTNHLEQVVSLDFSPDGTLLATAGGDQTIKLWNTDTWQEVMSLKGHENEVSTVGFSRDGKLLISSGKDGTVRIWRVDRRGSPLNSMTLPHNWFVPAGCPSSERLLLLSADLASSRWLDLKSLSVSPAQAAPPTLKLARAFCANRNCKLLAIALREGPVEIWRTDPCSKAGVVAVSPIPAYALALGETGRWLALQRTNDNLEIWEITENRLVKTLGPNGLRPLPGVSLQAFFLNDLLARPFSFYAGDRRLVRFQGQSRQEKEDKLEVMLIPENETRLICPRHQTALSNYAIDRDGFLLATAGWDGQVKLWDLRTGRQTATLLGQLVAFIGLAFSPDGSRLAAGGWDGSITLWDVRTRQQVAVWKAQRRNCGWLSFADDERMLASIGDTPQGVRELSIWRAPSGAEIEAAEAKDKKGLGAP